MPDQRAQSDHHHGDDHAVHHSGEQEAQHRSNDDDDDDGPDAEVADLIRVLAIVEVAVRVEQQTLAAEWTGHGPLVPVGDHVGVVQVEERLAAQERLLLHPVDEVIDVVELAGLGHEAADDLGRGRRHHRQVAEVERRQEHDRAVRQPISRILFNVSLSASNRAFIEKG